MTWHRWIEPRSNDERVAQQELLVNLLSLVALAFGILYLVVWVVIAAFLGGPAHFVSILGGVLSIALALGSYLLSRSGRVRAAAVLVVFAGALIGFYSAYVRGTITVAAIMIVPTVLFASVVISGRAGAITAAVTMAFYIALTVAQQQGWVRPASEGFTTLTGLVLTGAVLALVAAVLWQTLHAQDTFLRQAQEREKALQALADDKDRLLAKLQDRDTSQRLLLEMVRELGSPIIPLAQGIVALPLVGAMDSQRSQQMMTALLQSVAAYRARAAIVDITGVPVVDTAVAGALFRAAQGVRLLGCTPILVGIRPEVARTLIEMGVAFEGLITRSSLQEGLVEALGLLGARIVVEEEAGEFVAEGAGEG
jgi:anti-anti-sigma regulatory factor